MKWLIVFWGAPVAFLFSWYGLSYYDLNFGYRILSRDLHDLVFTIYGDLLGVPPETVPGMVLKAIIVDTILVFAIVWLRYKRKTLASVVVALYRRLTGRAQSPEAARASEASLSSAP